MTREAIENEIERLIELLDVVDGDCDLENSIGYDQAESSDEEVEFCWFRRNNSEHEDDEDCGDDEPNLGWTATGQHGSLCDCEHDWAELGE